MSDAQPRQAETSVLENSFSPIRSSKAGNSRAILLARTPEETGQQPWQQLATSSQYYRYSQRPTMRFNSSLGASTSGRNNDGTFARWMNWLAGTGVSMPEVRQSAPRAVPDFLAQVDSPDKRKQPMAKPQRRRSEPMTQEEEWREDCLEFAKLKNLRHVEEMRIVSVELESRPRDGGVLVMVVGAHYRPGVLQQEDLILHVVKEMEKVGEQKYTVVYFNAEAELGKIPDTLFFQQLHAALHPAHKRNLQAFYVVHPTALLKTWIFMLRLAIPEIYGRVIYLSRLKGLYAELGSDCRLDVPQHVVDFDRNLK